MFHLLQEGKILFSYDPRGIDTSAVSFFFCWKHKQIKVWFGIAVGFRCCK